MAMLDCHEKYGRRCSDATSNSGHHDPQMAVNAQFQVTTSFYLNGSKAMQSLSSSFMALSHAKYSNKVSAGLALEDDFDVPARPSHVWNKSRQAQQMIMSVRSESRILIICSAKPKRKVLQPPKD